MIQIHITSVWDLFTLAFAIVAAFGTFVWVYFMGRDDGAWAETTRRWDEEDAALQEWAEQIDAWEEAP